MNTLNKNPNLKEINAYKKKISWGDLPTIFHMAYNAISDVDSILSHGFDSAYKRMFNKEKWNLNLLEGFKDDEGNTIVKRKPKIALLHIYTEQNYELHCFPVIKGELIENTLHNSPRCPFIHWTPETMQMLFRISSFVSFMTYHTQGGDEADLALMKFAHFKVEELIELLEKTFDVTQVSGRNIAEFYREIQKRKDYSVDASNKLNNSM